MFPCERHYRAIVVHERADCPWCKAEKESAMQLKDAQHLCKQGREERDAMESDRNELRRRVAGLEFALAAEKARAGAAEVAP